MGCQRNEFIVPSPSVDFPSNNQIPKHPTMGGVILPSGP